MPECKAIAIPKHHDKEHMVSESEAQRRNNYTILQRVLLTLWVSRCLGSNRNADATLMEDAEATEKGNEKALRKQK